MKIKIVTLISAVVLAISLPVQSDEPTSNEHSIYLVPSVAYNFLDKEGNIDSLSSFGLNLGYQWDQQWAFELGFQSGTTETRFGDDADMTSWNIDALYSFHSTGNWQPYAVGTLKALSFEVDTTRNETLTGLGIGSYYRLSENTRLRGDVRALYSYDDNLIDYTLMLGIQFTLGGKAK